MYLIGSILDHDYHSQQFSGVNDCFLDIESNGSIGQEIKADNSVSFDDSGMVYSVQANERANLIIRDVDACV